MLNFFPTTDLPPPPTRSDTQEITSLREEVDSLTNQMTDFQRDVQGSREREAELLGFTEKLSSKNAQLQSESNALQTQLDQQSRSFTELQGKLEETSGLLDQKVGGTLRLMLFGNKKQSCFVQDKGTFCTNFEWKKQERTGELLTVFVFLNLAIKTGN